MAVLVPPWTGLYARDRSEAAFPELWDGLVGCWLPGFEKGGSRFQNWSTNLRDATGEFINLGAGSISWTPTRYGWGLEFDGTSDACNVGTKVFAPGGVDISFVGHFYPWNSNRAVFSTIKAPGYAGWEVSYGHGSGMGQAWEFWNGSSWVNAGYATSLKTWQSVAISNTNGQTYFAINGTLTSATHSRPNAQLAGVDSILGERQSFTGVPDPYAGTMVGVRIYWRGLKTQELYRLSKDPLYHPLTLKRQKYFFVSAGGGATTILLSHILNTSHLQSLSKANSFEESSYSNSIISNSLNFANLASLNPLYIINSNNTESIGGQHNINEDNFGQLIRGNQIDLESLLSLIKSSEISDATEGSINPHDSVSLTNLQSLLNGNRVINFDSLGSLLSGNEYAFENQGAQVIVINPNQVINIDSLGEINPAGGANVDWIGQLTPVKTIDVDSVGAINPQDNLSEYNLGSISPLDEFSISSLGSLLAAHIIDVENQGATLYLVAPNQIFTVANLATISPNEGLSFDHKKTLAGANQITITNTGQIQPGYTTSTDTLKVNVHSDTLSIYNVASIGGAHNVAFNGDGQLILGGGINFDHMSILLPYNVFDEASEASISHVAVTPYELLQLLKSNQKVSLEWDGSNLSLLADYRWILQSRNKIWVMDDRNQVFVLSPRSG